MQAGCPFCYATDFTPSYLPATFFNGKTFRYVKCRKCDLHYVSPFPDAPDFDAMYPPAYQAGINAELCRDPYEKIGGIRFSYGKQFDLIRKYAPGKHILDYGCGNANFLINAKHAGFACDGTEYNAGHLQVLKDAIEGSEFYLLEDFFANEKLKYDVIRLSNVLEHLTDPREIIGKLVSKLNPGGLLLVEGPVENNFTLALLIRKLYFSVRHLVKKNPVADHVPTHIFYSNAKNQRAFFGNYPLVQKHYELDESEWPFPEKWERANDISGKLMFLFARLSMLIRPLSRNWGNTFIYVGQAKSSD